MRVNTNISALIANNNLKKSENMLSASIERLSSGYKINHAKDNPAGIAISNKMRTQIRGLERAESNASDGISVVETAEGALAEIEAIIQRMNELAVKAVNDTNADDDREAIQLEVDALKEEIDRIAGDTEFNDQLLLNGDFTRRVYFNDDNSITLSDINLTNVTDAVPSGEYGITVDAKAEKAQATINLADLQPGVVYQMNGYNFQVPEGATTAELRDLLEDVGKRTNLTTVTNETSCSFTSADYGKTAYINFVDPSDETKNIKETGEDVSVSGIDNFSANAIVTTSGDKIKITDIDGFELSLRVGDFEGDIIAQVHDIGTMKFQIGANEGQDLRIDLPEVSSYQIGLDTINFLSKETAEISLAKVADALTQITYFRTELGAYQNRFEYSISNLGVSQENMNAAISRIKDVDMAEEMTEYTQSNVLSQAATSVLAQANARPEMVLQLLQ